MITYILRTSRGANVLAFDSLERALETKVAREAADKFKLAVVRRTVVEEVVA